MTALAAVWLAQAASQGTPQVGGRVESLQQRAARPFTHARCCQTTCRVTPHELMGALGHTHCCYTQFLLYQWPWCPGHSPTQTQHASAAPCCSWPQQPCSDGSGECLLLHAPCSLCSPPCIMAAPITSHPCGTVCLMFKAHERSWGCGGDRCPGGRGL